MKIKLFDLLNTTYVLEMVRIVTKVDEKELLMFRGIVEDVPRYVWTKRCEDKRVHAYVTKLYTIESLFGKGSEIVLEIEYK